MPIPSKEENEKMEKHAIEEIGLNNEWKVSVEVKPWLGADLFHEIDTENKAIKFLVYSAKYPWSWHHWKDSSFKQLRRQLERLKEAGKIGEWKAKDGEAVDTDAKDYLSMSIEDVFEEIKTMAHEDRDRWESVKDYLKDGKSLEDDEEAQELATRIDAADMFELSWLYKKVKAHDEGM